MPVASAMKTFLITFGLIIALGLIHFAYVDFRFRYRDGVVWFWRLSPAPVLMWVGRALFVAAAIFAGCMVFMGASTTFFWILGGLVAAHIVSMILLEALEPR
jgi:hypothetical protein